MKKILFISVLSLILLFSYQINTAARTISRFEIEKTGQVVWEVNSKEKILFHDWHGFEDTQSCKTADVLGNILNFLQKNGYTCVTVSELLYRSTHMIPESFNIYPSKRTQTSQINLMF
ncbi:hypothetical protein BIV60_17030 [Bacillus sp. MUM 116]|uniref:hypothetical protein n=1 Tax=Bacillus sp. MUM 116 TaxID=1678002 RepID=UPI0008F5CA52|nr:hypothetical protein [Bacillus sp. MUM 116]OIK12078.1 hypothetical protein BIV60_17030 [Bacillus sp. MUM 116]